MKLIDRRIQKHTTDDGRLMAATLTAVVAPDEGEHFPLPEPPPFPFGGFSEALCAFVGVPATECPDPEGGNFWFETPEITLTEKGAVIQQTVKRRSERKKRKTWIDPRILQTGIRIYLN